MFNNISEAFLEITTIPFLFVLSVFLGGRMATKSEINRRFVLLVTSTLTAAFYEVVLELFTDMEAVTLWRKVFYAVINVNAYCLMSYVAAYTNAISRRFTDIHFFVLTVSVILVFMFKDIYMVFAPGLGVVFVLEGFVLQLIYQEYYGNGQFIVMNILFILLIDSFVMQYLFRQNLPLVYTIATMMLVFTFFYLEAPTYRRLISAQREIEDERKRAEASMLRADSANKAKSNFLASTSHEIRTPMNAILGINEMILSEAKDAETRKASSDIKNAGEHLLNIVNNILDISKIEAGKMDLYESDYHLWDLLKECEALMTEQARPAVKFILKVDKALPEHLHGDVLRLKQALTNLLSNSAKYEEALACYKQVVSDMPGTEYSNDALLSIQSIYTAMKQPEKYIEYLEANNLSTGTTEADRMLLYYNTAEQVFLAGNYSGAVKSFTRFLGQYPDSKYAPAAYYYLAESFKYTDQKEKACEYYRRSIEEGLTGSYAELAIVNYASVSYSLEHFEDAYRDRKSVV